MSSARILLGIALILSISELVSGWQFGLQPKAAAASTSGTSLSNVQSQFFKVSRRFFLIQMPVAVAVASLEISPTHAMTTDQARDQWNRSVVVIDRMLADWSSLEKKGGDGIRVELGTQGTTSPLFQIEKALRVLREEASDLVEFTEQSEEFQLTLSRADSMAYSANFAGGSGKPTPPAVYIEKSKKEVIALQSIAKSLSELL